MSFSTLKVLHPQIRETFARDLRIMSTVARWLTVCMPKLHWVNLSRCVDEFTDTLNKQLDMNIEQKNLEKFGHNFRHYTHIRVPTPLPKLCKKNILVETYEEGTSMADVLADSKLPAALKRNLARIGVDMLLRMVFTDNFVHADLHPGNILVQNIDMFDENVDITDSTPLLKESEQDDSSFSIARLVMLDCGITATLTWQDKLKFREVFAAVVKGDGVAVADLFLKKSKVNGCTDEELFREEMARVVIRGRHNLTNISKVS